MRNVLVVGLGGLLGAAPGLYAGWLEVDAWRHAEEVTGSVESVTWSLEASSSERTGQSSTSARFTAVVGYGHGGRTYHLTLPAGSAMGPDVSKATYHVGEDVEVRVDPRDPGHGEVGNVTFALMFPSFVAALLGLGGAAVGWALFGRAD